MSDRSDFDALLGDLEEFYSEWNREKGRARADLWAWSQVLKSTPRMIINLIYWRIAMMRNHILIAFRHIRKQKGLSLIHVLGLALGIACSGLLLLWVQDELSYDRFHENDKEIHRVVLDPLGASPTHEAVTPPILAETMKTEIPEVVHASRLTAWTRQLVTYGDQSFYEGNILFADPEFLEMFSFRLVKGDPKTALDDPATLIIDKDVAFKLFGEREAIGKVVRMGNQRDFRITGVIEAVPGNSHLQFKYILPFQIMQEFGRNLKSWKDVSFYTYVQLDRTGKIEEVNDKIRSIIEKYDPGHNMYYLQPLRRIYLHSNYNFDIARHGNIIVVYLFASAAVLILLIASINYMNLATARSCMRAKEVGIRKVVGAFRTDMVRQFYTESMLITLIATIAAILLILVVLPVFNHLSGKEFNIHSTLASPILLGLAGIMLFTGLSSGSYPALLLSAFRPSQVLRSGSTAGARGAMLRKILVVLQFGFTVLLIVGSLVVQSQIDHIQNASLGYDRSRIVSLSIYHPLRKHLDSFKIELLRHTNVEDVTLTSTLITDVGSGTSNADWEGKPDDVRVQMLVIAADYAFLETFRMEMEAGRFFSRVHATDSLGFILNETAVRVLGMESPIGKRFAAWGIEGHIIGIVKDFHFKSLHHPVEPMFMILDPSRPYYIYIRLGSGDNAETIRYIENLWERFLPEYPFEYAFLEQRIISLYGADERVGKLLRYSTFFAVFIACMGLFGLTSFTVEQRTKEIGIRKVLGASPWGIVILLTKQYLWLIIISNVTAWPLSWLIMRRWLETFASRVSPGIGIMLLAGSISTIIILITAGIHAVIAARKKPVDSLRYE